jgi:uncharacterized protein YggE
MNTNRIPLTVMAMLVASAPMAGAPEAQQRTVTVTGEAEVKVQPDAVTITLGLETRNRDLAALKSLDDQKTRSIIAALAAAGVPGKDIRMDYLNLQPELEGATSRRVLAGYIQRTTLLVDLKDLSRFDGVITASLQAGVEYIHGVEFRTSQLRRHRDEARSLALKAAREKAVLLAGELGGRLGRPRSIQEYPAGYWSSYGSWWGRGSLMGSQNVVQGTNSGNSGPEGPMAPGTISVSARVGVIFDLE